MLLRAESARCSRSGTATEGDGDPHDFVGRDMRSAGIISTISILPYPPFEVGVRDLQPFPHKLQDGLRTTASDAKYTHHGWQLDLGTVLLDPWIFRLLFV